MMSITESVRKMSTNEMMCYEMGYQQGRQDAVKHGFWKFEAHSFYYDEECPDGVAYVMANCSKCGTKHPNYGEVARTFLFRPEKDGDIDREWRFDKDEEEKAVLKVAEDKRSRLSAFCPHCGAMMDADETKEEVCNKEKLYVI
jgi:ribosomal protein S27AE